MDLLNGFDQKDRERIGDEMHRFAGQLYPVCRSITGDGIRQTLAKIQDRIPLEICQVATGTAVLDWLVPKEWNIRDAYIKGPDGKKVVDFEKCNLHVVNYSVPFRGRMSLDALKTHLFTVPEKPDWIPYRTSYYKEDWGFCLSHNQMLGLQEGEYEVCIDSTLEPGHLSYGECYLPGQLSDEILISCHICHPSLANDNLSGLAMATFLAQFLSGQDLRYSYRFLFIPGTIGAITWLARNREAAGRIRSGLVLTCVGDSGKFHYKKSRHGNAEIDRAAAHVLHHYCQSAEVLEFSPYGYDERQYCSPGFNLPVGCLMRSEWGTFPEYHTSADDLNFIQPNQLMESLQICAAILNVLEGNRRYRNLYPYGEPQLGRRGLYRSTGGGAIESEMNAILWVLNLSDGDHSLLDIAERSALPYPVIEQAARTLRQRHLLEVISEEAATPLSQPGDAYYCRYPSRNDRSS